MVEPLQHQVRQHRQLLRAVGEAWGLEAEELEAEELGVEELETAMEVEEAATEVLVMETAVMETAATETAAAVVDTPREVAAQPPVRLRLRRL